jgi:C-terminal processing protease CtpA/Prc
VSPKTESSSPGPGDRKSDFIAVSDDPSNGFLGPNAFKAFRVEIVYADSAGYFEKGTEFDIHDMDIVGTTLRPFNDGKYQVIAAVKREGIPVIEGIEPGYIHLQIDDLKTTGATMDAVVDASRGRPGEICVLKLEREGKSFTVEATVERIL